MKMKDSRLIGSVYRVDLERIVGVNLGHDKICELSKLITGNRNKLDSVEVSGFTKINKVDVIGYSIILIQNEHRIEFFIPENKDYFTFDIPKDIKQKIKKEEETSVWEETEETVESEETVKIPEVIENQTTITSVESISAN